MIAEDKIKAVGDILLDSQKPLKARFRALFTLRNVGGPIAIDAISKCFTDDSALLKHELAYCLGQIGDSSAIPILQDVLEDENQETIVRHEAGEALGAIGDASVLDLLEHYENYPVHEISETCQLAVDRIKWAQDKDKNYISESGFASVDPAPPSDEKCIIKLQEQLMDKSLSLFDRYRAMFSLRNLNTSLAAKEIAKGFTCSSSALFRHEVAFVLGQMMNDIVVGDLIKVLENCEENEMVRHEAAEALGVIGSEKAMSVLQRYLNDDKRIVRESCEVALDILDYENSSEFQYADDILQVS